jgi:hypothetical protein
MDFTPGIALFFAWVLDTGTNSGDYPAKQAETWASRACKISVRDYNVTFLTGLTISDHCTPRWEKQGQEGRNGSCVSARTMTT